MKTHLFATATLLSTLLHASAEGPSVPPVPLPPPPPPPGTAFLQDEPPFFVNVTPPVQGDTGSTIHIIHDGKEITRRVNAGNASEIRVENGNVIYGAGHGSGSGPGAVPLRGPGPGSPTGISTFITRSGPPPAPSVWLGVATDSVPEEVQAQLPLTAGTGLLVRTVVPESPAAKAGIQKNDVLTKLDDQILVNPDQLRTLVTTRKEGETIKLTTLHQGKESVLEAKLGTRAGGDDPWSVATFFTGHPDLPSMDAVMKPLVLQSRALVIDSKGNVVTGSAAPALGVEATELQQALKKAGVSKDVTSEVERTLGAVRLQLEQSKTQLEKTKGDTVRRLEESAEELAKALQRAKEAMKQSKAAAEKNLKKIEEAVPAGAPSAPALPAAPIEPATPVTPTTPTVPATPGAL